MFDSIRRIFISLGFISLMVFTGNTVLAQPSPWPEIKKEMRPWTRWWWMGNAVNEQGLSASLEKYQRAGIGGVEIASIYGVKGNEQQEIEYLSPRWMQMLAFTVKKAGELNMGVDLTNGTGWPFGGPQVTPETAASKLIVQQYNISGRKRLEEKILIDDPKQDHAALQFVTAYSDKGGTVQLDEYIGPDGNLKWTAPAGNWRVYAAFNGKTRQVVKRFSTGGEGYSMNHFSKNALQQYLRRFDLAFSEKQPGVRAFYNDSYEVYDADWSGEFLTAFRKNRGYDFRPYIREFLAAEPSDLQSRLKSDYRETMSEMLLEYFTKPWTAWAHGYRSLTKNQAHGSPGNLLDLYAAVDIPECETFGSSYFPIPGLRRDSADIRNVNPDPVMLRFASSAAHVSGHNLVSCETFTWLTEHFKTSLSQCKPEVEQVFLAGINHVFFHGTTYYPPETAWPGWMFYASVNFVPSNSFWPHLPGLTSYISRVQSVLQHGRPDNELLVYWPVYDAWHKASGKDMPFKVHDVDEWLHPTAFYRNASKLVEGGYSADYISDHLLEKASVNKENIFTSTQSSYKVLVIPAARLMPLSTLQKIIQLAQDGATVIFQKLPEDVPGLGDLEQKRIRFKATLADISFRQSDAHIRVAAIGKGSILLSDDIQKALQWKGIRREELTDTGLQFIRRRSAENTFYYLVNHTPKAVDQDIPLNCEAGSVTIMDPQTGVYGQTAILPANRNTTRVKIQMQPGEALILKVTRDPAEQVPAWTYLGEAGNPMELSGNWTLHFTEGQPGIIPGSKKLKRPVDWTSLSDSAANAFSGSGVYSIVFRLSKAKASEYILDLGKVHESAHVWVNGMDAGILWSFPFRTRIGSYLKPGKNEIKIEVANLMANRIRSLDRQGIPWKKFKDINVVNINYKPFDASGWKVMPSGLAGPVMITPYSKK